MNLLYWKFSRKAREFFDLFAFPRPLAVFNSATNGLHVARRKGFEPLTYGLELRSSIQLS